LVRVIDHEAEFGLTDEDVFAEVETEKVLVSWRFSLDKDSDVSVIRGIDALDFSKGKPIHRPLYRPRRERKGSGLPE